MKKFKFKNLCKFLHLWLGLVSGLIITIVALTGCIYAFEPEIRGLLQPYQYVEVKQMPFLSPYKLKEMANPYVFKCEADSSNAIYGVIYGTANKAVKIAYNDVKDGYSLLYLNPYTGENLGKMVYKDDFFRFILSGHRNLWLPYQIGHTIVGWAVVIFVILIVTGIIISLPKRFNRKSLKTLFTMKFRSTKERLNYDAHKVWGMYVGIFALIIALTGLTWSFSSYADTYYKIISGGKDLKRWSVPVSDSIVKDSELTQADKLWQLSLKTYPIGKEGVFMFDFPLKPTDPFRTAYNPDESTYYKRVFKFFNQSDLEELSGGGIYGEDYNSQIFSDKLYRMTYDIHVGSVAGLFGRIIVFVISLIIATLPITGFIIYWKKRHRKRRT